MGLLDEAIREHLELKRRRGADPGEIARAEHEALEPIFPEESSTPEGEAAQSPLRESEPDEGLPYAEEAAVEPLAPPVETPDFTHVGQETAELDMQAVLEADPEHSPQWASLPQEAARPVRAPSAQRPEGDAMEWGPVGRSEREPIPEEIPGQERLSFE